MSTQPVSETAVSAGGSYDALSGKISELTRLEQSIKKMKSDYEEYSKGHGGSSSDVNAKIKELNSLISKVQRQIEQIKRAKKKSGGVSSGTAKSSGFSQYKYLGSFAEIYKRAFSLAHSASLASAAAVSGNLKAPEAAAGSTLAGMQQIMSAEPANMETAVSLITKAQADSPADAIDAAFSDGIDTLG